VLAILILFGIACGRDPGTPSPASEDPMQDAPPRAPLILSDQSLDGIPLLTKREVKALGALKSKDRSLDPAAVNPYSFEYVFREQRDHIEPLLASEGLNKRTFLRLVFKVHETCIQRAKILEPYEALKKHYDSLGSGKDGAGPAGDEKQIAEMKAMMKARIDALEKKATAIKTNLLLLKSEGLVVD
jgi:hypothetical protein